MKKTGPCARFFFCLKKENSRVGTAVFAIEGIKKKQELFSICQDVPLQIH